MTTPATMTDLEWELLLNLGIAAFASFGGAFGAWIIARRADQSDRIMEELTATNHAIALAGTYANMLLNVKEQIVLPTLERYRSSFEAFTQQLRLALAGHGGVVAEGRLDYQRF